MKIKYLLLFFISIFAFQFSIGQSWLWGEEGKGGYGVVWSNAVDGYGNCYYTGPFYWSTLFSSYNLTDNGNASNVLNMFLIKSDNSGNILWAKQTINMANNRINASTSPPWTLTIDHSGNSYITSDFSDTVIIGLDTLINTKIKHGTISVFTAKYDGNGNVKWARQATLANDSSLIVTNSISTDNKGYIYIAGIFRDTIYFDVQKISSPSLVDFPFIVKYDSTGNVKWVRQATDRSMDIYGNGGEAEAITNDLNGNAFITGKFGDTINFGAYQLTCTLNSGGVFFITKYDANGNVKWAKQATIPTNASQSIGNAIITDKSGNVYVAGDFVDTVIFDNDTLIGSQVWRGNQNNFFLVKYDSSGNMLWVKQNKVLDSNNWSVQSISIDNYKHIYLSVLGGEPQANCKTEFGGAALSIYDTAKYDGVSMVFKLDSNGNTLCSSIMVGAAFGSNCIASDTSGNYVYFGGGTATPTVFGKDTVNPFSIPAVETYNIFPFIARWEECEPILGVNDITANDKFNEKVYPNPNNGGFTLSYQLQLGQTGIFTMYTTLGEKVAEYSLDANSTIMNINQSSLANGVYLYSIKVNNNVVKQDKVVIMK